MALLSSFPNWLELPRDITINILQRLDTIEIVTIVRHVCPLWRNICKEPLIWRTIQMINIRDSPYDLVKICHYAIERNCGQLEDIGIERFATDDLIKFIAENGNHLRRMQLIVCHEISEKGMIEVANQFPLLEELDILYSENLSMNFLEVIGQSCPLLKSLIFSRNYYCTCDDDAIAIGKTMTELRHLKIHGNVLTDEGLVAILDGCPLLESLDLQKIYCLEFTDILKKRCHDQINFLCLPNVKAGTYKDDYDWWKNFFGENSNDDSNSEYCCDYEDDDF